MRSWSLRGWLLLISLSFALLVAGGVALTTYVIVFDGMQIVVYEATERVAQSAESVVQESAAGAWERNAGSGYPYPEAVRAARADLVRRLSDTLRSGALERAHYALYDENLRPLWASDPEARQLEAGVQRQQARDNVQITRSFETRGNLMRGLVRDARLGVASIHVPVSLPGGATGVLDVVYHPETEERMIDAIRLPMTVLALTTMLVMIVLVQTSMGWVLTLVNDLRKAADSIDAGRLDERLPAMGDNEIGELARSINRLIERLGRRAEAQARFVGDASHELATPVAGIRGYTNILRAWGADDPKVRDESIDAIDRESRRMARLTSDLLNLLHADQGLRLKSERFDLNAVVRDRLAATASVHIERDIEFVGPGEESLFMVGDSDRLEDVVSILLDNAGKYTPVGGVVTVQTVRRKDDLVITVRDTGVGIGPEELPHVFDRFFRSERARAEGEGGFGLGLAIAKSIVDNMGGEIGVTSTVGVGTTFEVVVPRGRP